MDTSLVRRVFAGRPAGPRRRALLAVGVSCAAAAGLAACGGSSTGSTPSPASGSSQQLEVIARDYSFDLSSQTVPAGWTELTLRNRGGEDHQVQLVKPKKGVTSDQFLAQLRKDEGMGSSLGMVDFTGGVNTVPPGGTSVAYSDLTPGDYVLLCFVPTADGTPHYEKGMVHKLHVSSTPGAAGAPASIGTIGLQDFSFTFPSGFNGHGTYGVTNLGAQVHEMELVKLKPGITPDQVKEAILGPAGSAPSSGPPPVTSAGGSGALDPATTGYVSLDLSPGTYMALCFVPDVQTHEPHVAEGMIASFTVK